MKKRDYGALSKAMRENLFKRKAKSRAQMTQATENTQKFQDEHPIVETPPLPSLEKAQER